MTVRDRDTLQAGARRRRLSCATIIGASASPTMSAPAVARAPAPRGRGVHGGALARVATSRTPGYKPNAELQPIYEQVRARARAGRARADARGVSRQRRRAARSGARRALLLDWQVGVAGVARARGARRARDRVGERRASCGLADGREIQYQRAAIEIANAADRDERLALDDARARARRARARADAARAAPARAGHHRVARASRRATTRRSRR